MTRTVTIDLDVNDAKAVRAWQRSRDNIAQFDQQGKKTQKTFGTMFANTTRSLAATAAGFAGVGSVIGGIVTAASLVRAEWENITSAQSAAAQSNLTFEQSLAQAVRNAAGIFEAADVRQRSLDLAQEAGITPAKAAGIIGSAVTSTGVTNAGEAQTAISAARAAAIYAPELDAGGTQALAGVAASGAKRFGVSPEAFIGFTQQVGGQANVRELTPLIENVAPVVSNLAELGFRGAPGAAGSLVSTLTQGLGDTTGEISGTAAINLAKSLQDRFGNQAGFQRADGSFDALSAIEAIQSDPQLRDKFLGGGDFFGEKFGKATLGKGKAFATIKGILTGGSFQAQQFAGSAEAIGGFDRGEETYGDLVSAISSVTPTEQVGRILESATAGVQADDLTGISSIIRDKGKTFQQSLGDSALSQRFSGYSRELDSGFGSNPLAAIDAFQAQLTAEASGLRRGRLISNTSASTGSYAPGVGQLPELRAPVTAREADVADRIDTLIQKFDEIEKIIEVKVNVNNRPAQAEVRAMPGDRKHKALNAPRANGNGVVSSPADWLDAFRGAS